MKKSILILIIIIIAIGVWYVASTSMSDESQALPVKTNESATVTQSVDQDLQNVDIGDTSADLKSVSADVNSL